jgi:hypothetical protein
MECPNNPTSGPSNAMSLQTYESPDVSDFQPPNILFVAPDRKPPRLYPFDPANVTIGLAKQNTNGRGKSATIEYRLEADGKVQMVPLRLQTPKMSVIFGYSERVATEDRSATPSIGLAFRNKDYVPEIRAFYQAMWLLDQRIKEEAHRCYKSWFINKWRDLEKSPSTIDVNQYALTRIGTDKNGQQYPPTFNIKCKKIYNAFAFHVFSPSCGSCGKCRPNSSLPVDGDCLAQLTPSDITRGSQVVAIVEMKQIWITDKYGLSCDLVQCQLYQNPLTNACAIVQTGTTAEDDESSYQALEPRPMLPELALTSTGNTRSDFFTGKRRSEPTIQSQQQQQPAKRQRVEADDSGSDSEPAPNPMAAILTGMTKAARSGI